jgi:hypothetical protein
VQQFVIPSTTVLSFQTQRLRLLPGLPRGFGLEPFGSPMKVLAVVTDPHQCRRILLHLINTGAVPWAGLYAVPWAGLYAAPPGLNTSALN